MDDMETMETKEQHDVKLAHHRKISPEIPLTNFRWTLGDGRPALLRQLQIQKRLAILEELRQDLDGIQGIQGIQDLSPMDLSRIIWSSDLCSHSFQQSPTSVYMKGIFLKKKIAAFVFVGQ